MDADYMPAQAGNNMEVDLPEPIDAMATHWAESPEGCWNL